MFKIDLVHLTGAHSKGTSVKHYGSSWIANFRIHCMPQCAKKIPFKIYNWLFNVIREPNVFAQNNENTETNTMAEYLASIFGTEKDKVNCSFYFKIGACRHGDKCSRLHNRPTFSQTCLLANLFQNPQNQAAVQVIFH